MAKVQIVPQPLLVKKWDSSGTALLTNNSSKSSRICQGIFSLTIYPADKICFHDSYRACAQMCRWSAAITHKRNL